MLGLVAEGGPLALRTQGHSHRQIRRAGATFLGKTHDQPIPGSRPTQIPLPARSSKGLTGWVTKYPLRGDVANAKRCAIASNYPRGDRGCVPPVDRTYASVHLIATPGPSCFDSGPEPRPGRYVVFRTVTGGHLHSKWDSEALSERL